MRPESLMAASLCAKGAPAFTTLEERYASAKAEERPVDVGHRVIRGEQPSAHEPDSVGAIVCHYSSKRRRSRSIAQDTTSGPFSVSTVEVRASRVMSSQITGLSPRATAAHSRAMSSSSSTAWHLGVRIQEGRASRHRLVSVPFPHDPTTTLPLDSISTRAAAGLTQHLGHAGPKNGPRGRRPQPLRGVVRPRLPGVGIITFSRLSTGRRLNILTSASSWSSFDGTRLSKWVRSGVDTSVESKSRPAPKAACT